MDSLLNDPDLLFPSADKGLGPCAVTYDRYIEDCLVHLKNRKCYSIISEEDAKLAIELLEDDIEKWLKRHKHAMWMACMPNSLRSTWLISQCQPFWSILCSI
jgi:hypothetical protein